MPYHHRVSTHHKVKKAKKIKRFAQFATAMVFLFGLIVGVDWLINRLNTEQNVSVQSTAAVQSSNINIFRTPFFQFQTDNSWREITSESTEKRFVYRSLDGLLVQQELIVEIDGGTDIVLANESTTRAYPVQIKNNKLQPTTTISEHCRDLTPVEGDRKQQIVEYEKMTFPCNPDASAFAVLVGQSGGRHYLEKPTFDGIRTYKIAYRDSTFSPAGRDLPGIVKTFQLL